MKTIIKGIVPFTAFIFLMASCGNKEKSGNDLNQKKVQLEKLKSQKTTIDQKIEKLEKEIAALDTSFSDQKPKLVAISPIERVDFKHYVNLQGVVNAKNVSYITPAGQPGQIKAIYVKEGDKVRKGQLILKLDNSVILENVNAARQQLSSINAQLDLAKSIYARQKNLWNQNIGTEVQLLQAKTNMESLEGQLKTVQANVKTIEAQANQNNVYSNIDGVIDEVTAHVGETFNGNPLSGGYIKVVSAGNMKVNVTIPENYMTTISKGSNVVVEFPDKNRSFNGTISFLSQTIGATTRGFDAEIRIPAGFSVKPNQTVFVKILDYHAPNAITIPLNTVQNDENGKFVLVAVEENGHLIARKKPVDIGQFSGDSVEIKQGLQTGEMLITDGYQSVFDGQILTTSGK